MLNDTAKIVLPAFALGMSATLLFQKFKNEINFGQIVPKTKRNHGVGNVLLTGGAGYIGSHVLVELLNLEFDVVVVDNLSNSSEESLRRVEQITGKKSTFYRLDIRDKTALRQVFSQEGPFDVVMHFAGLKGVGESSEIPLQYFDNNICGSVALLQVMEEYGSQNLVFSSSATVYGTSAVPYAENALTGVGITNPYGRTKYMVEEMLKDLAQKDSPWNIVILRYFNPIGAHESGLIGEDPCGVPNNLMPYVAQVCIGRRPKLTIFGDDYDTIDGTGVRDYIHVVDLAKGHVAALRKLLSSSPDCHIFNLGCGRGSSVLQVVAGMEKVCGNPIPYVIGPRRLGDLATCYASAEKAWHDMKWKTEKSLDDMCKDTWKWQSSNPNGYRA